jgi:hypothetical protein
MMLAFALACATDTPGPPPPGSGMPATAGAGVSGADADGEDGDPTAPADTDPSVPDQTCDPWGDPASECGPGRACSFVDMRCHDAPGMAGADEPCELLDDDAWIGTCVPWLVCVLDSATQGRCALPCQDDGVCGVDRRCRMPAGDSPTRACVLLCDPFAQDCLPDEGCYVLHPEDPAPLCAIAGPGLETDPCTVANDCAVDHHCTNPASHMVPCADAVGCCTPLCDVEIGDCVGINPLCVPLGVPDAPNLGVCIGDV